MKNYFLIIVLLLHLIPRIAFGNEFKKYVSYTNYAELAIIDNNYMLAEKYYDTAFRIWNKPFAIDIFNYLKCANLNTNYSKVKMLAFRLIKLGCELSFFENSIFLTGFRASPEWRTVIDNYSYEYNNYIKNNDWKLRSLIQQLVSKDQLLRQIDPAYSLLRDSIYSQDEYIKANLVNFLKKKFPNEYDYGIFLSDDTSLSILHPLEFIIMHNYGSYDSMMLPIYNQKNVDYTKQLLTAVNSGYISPEIFGLINDRSGKFRIGYGFGQDDILIENKGKLYYNRFTPEIWQDIAANRLNIGLCSSEDGRRKIIYMNTKNEYKFLLRKSSAHITRYNENLRETTINLLYVYTGVSIK